MPSLRTIYRTIVMIAVGVLVVQGWQLYGPPTDTLLTLAVQGVEMAQSAWSKSQRGVPETADPRIAAPVAGSELSPADVGPPPLASGPPVLSADLNMSSPEVAAPPLAEEPVSAAAELESAPQFEADADERLSPLLARLEELGAADPQLAPWGASGQLYRFCCRAKLTETHAYARHFEAVAAEPRTAVEQVVAKVEEWRMAQRDEGAPR